MVYSRRNADRLRLLERFKLEAGVRDGKVSIGQPSRLPLSQRVRAGCATQSKWHAPPPRTRAPQVFENRVTVALSSKAPVRILITLLQFSRSAVALDAKAPANKSGRPGRRSQDCRQSLNRRLAAGRGGRRHLERSYQNATRSTLVRAIRTPPPRRTDAPHFYLGPDSVSAQATAERWCGRWGWPHASNTV